MHTLIVILHVIVSVALILVILLQTGKGSDIGAVFGGGSSQTLFGSTGPTSFLSKMTAGAAHPSRRCPPRRRACPRHRPASPPCRARPRPPPPLP